MQPPRLWCTDWSTDAGSSPWALINTLKIETLEDSVINETSTGSHYTDMQWTEDMLQNINIRFRLDSWYIYSYILYIHFQAISVPFCNLKSIQNIRKCCTFWGNLLGTLLYFKHLLCTLNVTVECYSSLIFNRETVGHNRSLKYNYVPNKVKHFM